eukprot:2194856-Pyramimonas_sp.AAC.1
MGRKPGHPQENAPYPQGREGPAREAADTDMCFAHEGTRVRVNACPPTRHRSLAGSTGRVLSVERGG